MKKHYLYLLFAAIIVTAACKKSYLVQNPPTAVPVANAIKTENDLSDAVNGMYGLMESNTFFGRDIPVIGDELADNVYISAANSNRYLSENNYSVINVTTEPLDLYTQGYFIILQANRIIAAPVAPTSATDVTVSQLKGEAYISRALTYLELVNYFGTPYTVNPTALGVPLITAATNSGNALTLKPARATVTAIYGQIISDLDSAYAIMPTTAITLHAKNSLYLSKYAAKAIEARAYLYKGDYANAAAAALLVVQNGGYTFSSAANLGAYWASTAPTTGMETIFELGYTSTVNNGTNGLDFIYNQPIGYGDCLVTPDLYNLYTATDARRALILTSSPVRGSAATPVLVNNKFPYSALNKVSVKIIRYAEVVLTLAEAYAQTGDNVDALTYVNMLAKQRDPSFAGYTDTGAALITDILNERRKELAFEGLRFFDFTRLNLPIVRPQLGSLSAQSIALIPVGDTRRIFPIPFNEINANPNTVQNPGY